MEKIGFPKPCEYHANCDALNPWCPLPQGTLYELVHCKSKRLSTDSQWLPCCRTHAVPRLMRTKMQQLMQHLGRVGKHCYEYFHVSFFTSSVKIAIFQFKNPCLVNGQCLKMISYESSWKNIIKSMHISKACFIHYYRWVLRFLRGAWRFSFKCPASSPFWIRWYGVSTHSHMTERWMSCTERQIDRLASETSRLIGR